MSTDSQSMAKVFGSHRTESLYSDYSGNKETSGKLFLVANEINGH